MKRSKVFVFIFKSVLSHRILVQGSVRFDINQAILGACTWMHRSIDRVLHVGAVSYHRCKRCTSENASTCVHVDDSFSYSLK